MCSVCPLSYLSVRQNIFTENTTLSQIPSVGNGYEAPRGPDVQDKSHLLLRRKNYQSELMELLAISPQYGPILIGVCLNMVLYGVLLCQIYTYYLLYRKTDPTLNKCLIVYVLLAESVHTALTIYMVYEPLVVDFGNHDALNIYPRALAPVVALMGCMSLPTQTFISWKIIRLQKSFWIGGVIGIFAAISFAGSILSSYQIKHHVQFTEKRALFMSAILWLSPGAAADLIIAVSLSFSLYKRKTGLKTTDAILSRIIRFTLQTGIVTSVAALLNLLTLLTLPIGNSINFIFNIVLMKTYSNFLLATLNARAEWTDGLQHVNGSILFADMISTSHPFIIPGDGSPPKLSFIRTIRDKPTAKFASNNTQDSVESDLPMTVDDAV